MDSESGDIPVQHVTVDQVVAGNIRHWRRAAGMTQEELGSMLGWSAANVSAAERSADPTRDARRFDAQTLTDLSLALGIPLVALFFPPEDDGERAEYVFTGPGGERDMGGLMELVVMTDNEDNSPVMDAYRQRFRAAAGRYLDPGWQEDVGTWMRSMEPAEVRAERADRLRSEAARLRAEKDRAARELESLADAIDPPGETA